MKKLIFILFFIVSISNYTFSENLPAFLIESNTGYSIGINIDLQNIFILV
jgi:hypothetical protein